MSGQGGRLEIDELIDRFRDESVERKARAIAASGRLVRVSRRPEIIVYLGFTGDYVIVDGRYCSCPGFSRRLSRPGGGVGCSHVLAARMPGRRVREAEVGRGELARIVWQVLTGGFTLDLRRRLYTGEGD